VSRHGQRQ
jgi:Protein of unknown function (DUF3551)